MKRNYKKKRAIIACLMLAFGLTGCQTREAANETMEQAGQEPIQEVAIEGLEYELPEGFTAHGENKGMYVSSEYPEDASYIYYQEQKADSRLALLNEDNIQEQMTAIYTESYGKETSVSVKDFHRVKINGSSGIRVETECMIDDTKVRMLEYVIDSIDYNYSISYVQIGDSKWWDEFVKSAETISVKK